MKILKKLLPKNEQATALLALYGTAIICRLIGLAPLFGLAASLSAFLATIIAFALSRCGRTYRLGPGIKTKTEPVASNYTPRNHSCENMTAPEAPGLGETSTVGSEHVIPTPEDLRPLIESKLVEPRAKEALKLAGEIAARYAEIISLGGQTDEVVNIPNLDCKNRDVTIRAEHILEDRGWIVFVYGDRSTVSLRPQKLQVERAIDPDALATIITSDDMAELIAEKVLAPRAAKALSLATELMRKYQERVKSGRATSERIRLQHAQVDYNVICQAEEILKERGWILWCVRGEGGKRATFEIRPYKANC